MRRRNALLGTVAVTAALTACMITSFAWAQAGYPERPVRVILPYAAGVSPDIVARLVAERLSPALGKPVIIDNRPGAGGMIGAEVAATMPPDGYNLLFTVKGVMAIVPHVYPSAKFNSLKDFKAVTEILQVPHLIVATNKAPFNSMKEQVEYAKKNPGKIKALATSGPERIPALPDLPTLTEFRADLDPNGATGNSWHGIFAPAGTPDAIIAKLNTEIVKVVKLPEVQQRLREYGLTPTGTSAEHLSKELAANYAYWGQIVKQLGVKVE